MRLILKQEKIKGIVRKIQELKKGYILIFKTLKVDNIFNINVHFPVVNKNR